MMQLWNWLDWILALVVLFSVLSGAGEGLTKGIIGLASLIVGVAVAAAGYHSLGDSLGSLIHSRELAYGLAFFILFVLVLVVGGLVARAAEKLVNTAGIRWLDRLLGLFFGLLRGIIVDAVIVMALLAFAINPEAIRHSQLAPRVMDGSRAMATVMPPELRRQFDAGLQALQRGLVKTEQRARQQE
jgi:membrane protein required for colicin V production